MKKKIFTGMILFLSSFVIGCFNGGSDSSKKDTPYEFKYLPQKMSADVPKSVTASGEERAQKRGGNLEDEKNYELKFAYVEGKDLLKRLTNDLIFIDAAFEDISANGSAEYKAGDIKVTFTEAMKERVLLFFVFNVNESLFTAEQVKDAYEHNYEDADYLFSELVGKELALPAISYIVDPDDTDGDGYNHTVIFKGHNKELAAAFDEVDGCTAQVFYGDNETLTIKWSTDKQKVSIGIFQKGVEGVSNIDGQNTVFKSNIETVFKYNDLTKTASINKEYKVVDSINCGTSEIIIQEAEKNVNIFYSYYNYIDTTPFIAAGYDGSPRAFLYKMIGIYDEESGIAKGKTSSTYQNMTGEFEYIQSFSGDGSVTGSWNSQGETKGDLSLNKFYDSVKDKDIEKFYTELISLM